jgi:hypothetical protein
MCAVVIKLQLTCQNTFNYNLSLQCIVPKAVYIQSKNAPEHGQICRPKHVGLISKD